MTVTEKEKAYDGGKGEYISVTAVPVPSEKDGKYGGPSGGEPPIPADHSRYYCEKCHSVSQWCERERWAGL